jgi:hypothetical protein
MMEKNNVVVGCWCIELQYWLLIHYFFVFFSFLEKCFFKNEPNKPGVLPLNYIRGRPPRHGQSLWSCGGAAAACRWSRSAELTGGYGVMVYIPIFYMYYRPLGCLQKPVGTSM